MTTPHSIERTIEDLRLVMREGCNCKSCESNLENIGNECVIRTAITTVAQEAEDRGYTRGRVDEAKTCEGCKKEKEHGITPQPDDKPPNTMTTRNEEIEGKCRRCNLPLKDCPKTRWTTPLCVVNGVEWDEHVIGISTHHQELQKAREEVEKKEAQRIMEWLYNRELPVPLYIVEILGGLKVPQSELDQPITNEDNLK